MTKLWFFDTETTGLNPVKNDVIQLSSIIDVGGVIVGQLNQKIKPFDFTTIQESALNVTGITEEDLYSFDPPKRAYLELVQFLGKYVNKFDRKDKFIPVAYNGNFDIQFIKCYFDKNGDKYFGSWHNWQMLDVLPLVRFYLYSNNIKLKNHKLETVCEHFKIPIDAHDAMSDITATRTLFYILKDCMKGVENETISD